MEMSNVLFHIFTLILVDVVALQRNIDLNNSIELENEPDNVFNGVYTECFFHLSYTCLQKKTLLYIKELNNLSEVSVIGDFVKFVKINMTDHKYSKTEDNQEYSNINNSDELAFMIDKAVDSFFNNHVLKFNALGKDISMNKNVEEFVGRKKRKGGGGGGGGDHGDHDGGKKKMMMMAMMCMKMKLMIMVPAMMGMMGMMSFKGMMFSMMSFMISKMMLLMKILEKKGGGAGFGGSGSGAGDGGWAAGGGSGGAWMPAGGQEYGGGGYDSNAQWQSRSIFELDDRKNPTISYVKPILRHNKNNNIATIKNINVLKNKILDIPKLRKKRDIIDIIHNSYTYWINKLFGATNKRRNNSNIQKYKTVNGVKYVFQPFRTLQKVKTIKFQGNKIKDTDEGFKPIITADDFNKGEIVEGAIESRMNRKKFHKMKDAVNETLDDSPWQ